MPKSTLVLNMILRNEGHIIRRCLEALKPRIDYYVIGIDSRTDDDTREVVADCLKDIPGEIFDFDWNGFGDARTQVLERANGKGTYHLIVDADDEIRFHCETDNLEAPVYHGWISEAGGVTEAQRPLLLRDDLDWVYDAPIHNYPTPRDRKTVDGARNINIEIHHHADGDSWKDPRTKYMRHATILEQELLEDPDNCRNQFYLAQCYHDAGEYERAARAYERHIKVGKFDQEVYASKIRLAGYTGKVSDFLAAHEYRPNRVDALFAIADSMREQGHWLLAEMFYHECTRILEKHGLVPDVCFHDTAIAKWKLAYGYSLTLHKLGELDHAAQWAEVLLESGKLPDQFRPEIEAIVSPKPDYRVVAGLATIRGREQAALEAIKSLQPQVDVIYVACDIGTESTFEGLDKVEVIPQDGGDIRKFIGLEIEQKAKRAGLYLSCDDDLIYPADYARNLAAGLTRCRGGIVSYHGRVLPKDWVRYYRDSVCFPCLDTVPGDVQVHIAGTGVMGFRIENKKVNASELVLTDKEPTRRNMADVHVSVMASEKGIPLHVLSHQAGWIVHSPHVDPERTIWAKNKDSDEVQSALLHMHDDSREYPRAVA